MGGGGSSPPLWSVAAVTLSLLEQFPESSVLLVLNVRVVSGCFFIIVSLLLIIDGPHLLDLIDQC